MNSILLLSIVAGVFTVIAGILHLSLVPGFDTGSTILFTVGGVAQIFWFIPTVKNWGKIWDYIGIVGTIAFILIWTISSIPFDPEFIDATVIITETSQIVFVILLGILVVKKSAMRAKDNPTKHK